MSVVKIASRKHFERWARSKSRAFAVAIAVRAALRALPAIAEAVAPPHEKSLIARLTFTTFRATLISSATVTGQADGMTAARAFVAARAAHLAAADARTAHANTAALAAYACAHAADAVSLAAEAHAAAYTAATDTATLAADAVALAAAAHDIAHAVTAHDDATHWREVAIDAEVLTQHDSDESVVALLQAPLWSQAEVPHWIRNAWTTLRNDERLCNVGFGPWFDWYESLLSLAGTSTRKFDRFSPELTRRIALQEKEWWDRGAEAVNADIASWLAEQEIPQQVPAAFRFDRDGDRIGLAPLDISTTEFAAAQAFLDELRERAVQMAERLASGCNAMPSLPSEISKLRDFLPALAVDLNPFLLRCRLASIDAAVATLQTAGPSRELTDDLTMQVTGLSFIGRELMLCFPDLRTREREEIARAIPLGQEQQIAKALAEIPRAAAQAPEVVTEQAVAALETVSAMARESGDCPPEVQRERIVEQVMVERNFLSEVVRFGWNLWDGVQPGVLGGAKAVSKHAVIFGFAGLVGSLTHPAVGLAALFAGYGQINRGLKLLEEQFGKRAKELKEAAKKPKAEA